MIESLFYLFGDEVFQDFEVKKVSRFRIYFAGDFHFEFVIVSMVIGVVAETEDGIVFFFRPVGIVETMSCVEMGGSEYGDFHCNG